MMILIIAFAAFAAFELMYPVERTDRGELLYATEESEMEYSTEELARMSPEEIYGPEEEHNDEND